MSDSTCSIAECDRQDGAGMRRGMCGMHYAQARRAGTLAPRPDAAARFWAKVDKSGDCWEWQGSKDPNGYGEIFVSGTNVRAHRFSYSLANGEFDPALYIDHRCHNPSCVNPDHLRVATPKQNQEHKLAARSDSGSGIRGVDKYKRTGRWRAAVRHNGRTHHVGYFATAEAAEAAVIAKRNELFTHNDADRAFEGAA